MLTVPDPPPTKNPPVVNPTVDPTPKDPVAVVDPPPNANPTPGEEVDAGEEEVIIDRNAVMGDSEISDYKDRKHITMTLDDMLSVMKQDVDREEQFEKSWKRIKKLCDEATTLRQLDNCEDELTKVSLKFYKN
jgi:hypothetical protein